MKGKTDGTDTQHQTCTNNHVFNKYTNKWASGEEHFFDGVKAALFIPFTILFFWFMLNI